MMKKLYLDIIKARHELAKMEDRLVTSMFHIYACGTRYVLVTCNIENVVTTALGANVSIVMCDENFNHITDVSLLTDADLAAILSYRKYLDTCEFPESTPGLADKFISICNSRLT